MTRTAVVVAVATLACAACTAAAPAAPPRTIAPRAAFVCIDDAFPPAGASATRTAAALWSRALRYRVALVPVHIDGAVMPPPAACDLVVYRTAIDAGDTTAGFVDAIGGRYAWIVDGVVPRERVRCVVVHEIGHLLGLRHDARGVMRATLACVPITEHEADAVL